MPTIDLINVTKRWGDFYAVDNLNLHIDDYSFITLLGPSGCGKTTTLRMIAGLETPTSGKILINGVPVFDSELGINVPASKRHVGFLFQNYALWPHMTVLKNIQFGLQNVNEFMPVVDSDYTQYKNDILVYKNFNKVIELVKDNIDKTGKVNKKRALIAIIDYFKVSMYTATKVFDLKLEEKTLEEAKAITDAKINDTTQRLEEIVSKYEAKGIELNDEGYVLTDPELADDYIALKLSYEIIKDYESLLTFIKEAKENKENVVKRLMSKKNISYKTAKTIYNFALDLEGKDAETIKNDVEFELKSYNQDIERIKAEYLNNGFHLNEKGEKIPNIDFENKDWDHKKVHQFKIRKLTNEEIDLKVRYVSRVVKIGEFMDRYPNELSGGQQQRVAIARTLAPGPKVLFMDEPLSNLDAKLRLEMRGELKRLHLETGSTFVYVTHDQLEAMTLATKICLMNNGVLQQYDAPLDVYKKPSNIFVADFVGSPAINFIEVKATQDNASNKIKVRMFDELDFEFTPTIDLNLEELRKVRDKEFEDKKNELEALKQDKKYVEKGNKDVMFNYQVAKVTETLDSDEEKEIPEDLYVIGIRPEFIKLSDDGKVSGEIYNALPSGMETIVKIRVGEFLLTSVIFGGVDYKVGSKCKLDFFGKEILLFDRKSGKLLSQGGLEEVN